MRIRQSFARQESADSKRPLINDDTDVSSLSLVPDTPNSGLCRPMAVIHINDSDPIDGRPKKVPSMNKEPEKTSAPTQNEMKRNFKEEKRRTVSLRDADPPEQKPHLKLRPVRKTVSQRQIRSGGNNYGSKFTRAFTRKSGFNLIFDEVAGGFADGFNSDSSSDIEPDLQKFEHLYRKINKKLKKRSKQSTEIEQEQQVTTSDPDMSPVSEDEKKSTCKETFTGPRMRKWAFWFIVFFLGLLTVKDVYELISDYSDNPKTSILNIVFNDTIQMPNITFCMDKNLAYSHFNLTDRNWDSIANRELADLSSQDRDLFLNTIWDYRLAVEGYEVISALSSMERETDALHLVDAITKFRDLPRLEQKRNMIQKWVNAIIKKGVTFEEFTQKVGIETIRPSMQRFQRFTFNDELSIQPKFHTSWISEKQFCFQPFSNDPNYMLIEDQGKFFTMSLFHGANLNKSNCLTVDFHGRPSSLNRFMEGKGRTRDGFDDELCMGQFHQVHVEIKALYEILENNDNGTICREDNKDNEFDCKSRCRLNMLRDLCKCTPLTLSYLVKRGDEEFKKFPLCDYTKCDLNVDNRNYSDSELECQKNCHRDCQQIRYNINHKTQGRLLRPDMTVLELHWGSFEYLKMKQNYVWSVPTFIAALGGSIGMWLGLSILSLIQGGSFIYSYLTDNVIKKKIRKHHIMPKNSTVIQIE